MRWELLDQFDVLKKNQIAKARKSFSGKEDFFKEHYLTKPFVPEALYIEMIAQAGGVLYGLGLDFEKEVILAKISGAKFHEWVTPPCELEIEGTVADEREEGAWIQGKVFLKKKLVAEAEILLVTMSSESLGFSKKIVFNEQFLKHYDILNIAKKSEALV